MLDQLLNVITQITWVLFAVYTIAFFVLAVRDYGFTLAVIRLFSYRVMVPLLIAIGITLISMAVVFIDPIRIGVVISVVSPGGIRPQPLQSGLHLIIPILEQAKTYPRYWQTYTMSGKPNEGAKAGDDSIRARTSDGQEVWLDCSVIFRVLFDQVVVLHLDWQDRYIEDFVRPTIRSVVRTQVSQFTVQEVNSSERKDLEVLLDRILRAEFDNMGLLLDRFLLRDVTFSPEYANSIERKQVALEEQEKARHEAQTMRNLAEGRADAIKIEAQAQSDALKLISEALQEDTMLLTYRYIDKLSPNIRAMLVPNNNPLILPLPDFMADAPTVAITPTTAITVTVMPTPAPSTMPDDRNAQ